MPRGMTTSLTLWRLVGSLACWPSPQVITYAHPVLLNRTGGNAIDAMVNQGLMEHLVKQPGEKEAAHGSIRKIASDAIERLSVDPPVDVPLTEAPGN